MIPPEAGSRLDEADFGELARSFEMSGGHIRNAALRAAFLAAGNGDVIDADYLSRAADMEYAAMGKVSAGAYSR